jgi:hypothetical protein
MKKIKIAGLIGVLLCIIIVNMVFAFTPTRIELNSMKIDAAHYCISDEGELLHHYWNGDYQCAYMYDPDCDDPNQFMSYACCAHWCTYLVGQSCDILVCRNGCFYPWRCFPHDIED